MSTKANLKDRFQNFGASPNASAWQNISAALPAKSRKKAVIWWFAGGVSVAASILISFLVFNSNRIVNVNFAEVEKPIQGASAITKLATFDEKNFDKVPTENLASPENKGNAELSSNSAKKTSTKPNKTPLEPIKLKGLNQTPQPLFVNGQKEAVSPDLAILHEKEAKQNHYFDSVINLLPPQETELLAVNSKDMSLKRIEVSSKRNGAWQWGGKLNSNYSLNSAQYESFNSWSSDLATTLDPIESLSEYFNQVPNFYKINRPINVAFLVRFSPIPRIFVQLNPNFAVLSAAPTLVPLVGSAQNTKFFSLGSDIKFGYKVIKRRRWSIDLATGIRFEHLFTKAPYISQDTKLNLLGNIAELGFSYHLTDNMSLRFAPEFSYIFGKAKDNFDALLKQQSNLGFGISLLKDF